MLDFSHHDKRLAGMLHMLSGTSVVPCNIDQEGTSFVRPFGLDTR